MLIFKNRQLVQTTIVACSVIIPLIPMTLYSPYGYYTNLSIVKYLFNDFYEKFNSNVKNSSNVYSVALSFLTFLDEIQRYFSKELSLETFIDILILKFKYVFYGKYKFELILEKLSIKLSPKRNIKKRVSRFVMKNIEEIWVNVLQVLLPIILSGIVSAVIG